MNQISDELEPLVGVVTVDSDFCEINFSLSRMSYHAYCSFYIDNESFTEIRNGFLDIADAIVNNEYFSITISGYKFSIGYDFRIGCAFSQSLSMKTTDSTPNIELRKSLTEFFRTIVGKMDSCFEDCLFC